MTKTRIRKTLDEKILMYEITVYCATMANFWHDKENEMYVESKHGIYAIIGMMVYYMGKNEAELLNYARNELNKYVLTDGNSVDYSIICNEI